MDLENENIILKQLLAQAIELLDDAKPSQGLFFHQDVNGIKSQAAELFNAPSMRSPRIA